MLDVLKTELATGFTAVPPAVAAIRLMAAVLLGACVGLERELSGKAAGLRTHILVSLAACLFILVSQALVTLDFGTDDSVRIDPLRLVEAVTTGVAFLGAGIIFRSDGRVRNVTTGTSVWLAGAIGLACGSGQIWLAAMAAVLVVAVIVILGWLENGAQGD
ncbi:MgtC/SapB family protein [Oceaniglobus roseus]|uniref:MgtC/SapB family protein n=1 Tax=Oceaniglobus roseus TaxID=1737570 RepID=UPI001FE73449|nr:MgtC/SapB family protein [Kandeliimicrobium roseum]